MIKIKIPIKVPTLNNFIDACKVQRGSWNAGNKMKQSYQQAFYYYFVKLPVLKPPLIMHFTWIEKNKRRDLDNISSVGRKFILDTLQIAGKLKNDNANYCVEFTDKFRLGKENMIIIEIEEEVDVNLYAE